MVASDDFCGTPEYDSKKRPGIAPGYLPGEDGGADSLATAGGSDRAVLCEGWPMAAAPIRLRVMLRVHCVQLFYNLSDPGMEDLLYEVESVRRFAGLRTGSASPWGETGQIGVDELGDDGRQRGGQFSEESMRRSSSKASVDASGTTLPGMHRVAARVLEFAGPSCDRSAGSQANTSCRVQTFPRGR